MKKVNVTEARKDMSYTSEFKARMSFENCL